MLNSSPLTIQLCTPHPCPSASRGEGMRIASLCKGGGAYAPEGLNCQSSFSRLTHAKLGKYAQPTEPLKREVAQMCRRVS